MVRATVKADAVVVGAGLHGLSVALHLARAGLRVVVVEKDRAGRHASGANAGGVRRLGRAVPELPLAQAALHRWHRISDLVDDDCGFAPAAQIKVAETETELAALQMRRDRLLSCGFSHEEIIGQAALRAVLPAAAAHCVGATIVHGDGHADPFRTVRAFSREAQSLGVALVEGTRVAGVDGTNGRWTIETTGPAYATPVLVNAAGAWGGDLAAMMGDRAPVTASALMLMITERLRPFLSPVVGAQGRALSFKQFGNGTVLIGGAYQGSADPETGTTTLDMRQLARNAAAATAIFPNMARARVLRGWAGIEGMTPDRLPVIGPASRDGGYHLFGFSAHGFALAPITGQIIADLILNGRTDLPIADFAIQRFAPPRTSWTETPTGR